MVSIFMISKLFPWKIVPDILAKLQYPWRMIGYFNLFSSFICGINLYLLVKYYFNKDYIKFIIVLLFVIFTQYLF